MRVREGYGRGEGAENDVAKLYAARRNYVTKREIVFTKEVGEVVKKDKEEAERAPVEVARGECHGCGA